MSPSLLLLQATARKATKGPQRNNHNSCSTYRNIRRVNQYPTFAALSLGTKLPFTWHKRPPTERCLGSDCLVHFTQAVFTDGAFSLLGSPTTSPGLIDIIHDSSPYRCDRSVSLLWIPKRNQINKAVSHWHWHSRKTACPQLFLCLVFNPAFSVLSDPVVVTRSLALKLGCAFTPVKSLALSFQFVGRSLCQSIHNRQCHPKCLASRCKPKSPQLDVMRKAWRTRSSARRMNSPIHPVSILDWFKELTICCEEMAYLELTGTHQYAESLKVILMLFLESAWSLAKFSKATLPKYTPCTGLPIEDT